MFTVENAFDYQRQYCAYYRVLEDDFCATEKYLTVNPDNGDAYSNEFIKLLQATCSELDVTLKHLCSLIDPNFKGETFPEYCKCIIDSNNYFVRANVSLVRVQSMTVAPWFGWSYKEVKSSDGKIRIQSENPEWWKIYNKVKHDRTTKDPKTKKEYYKFANQRNTLNALAALYIVNSYALILLCKQLKPEDTEYFLNDWYKSCKLFTGFLVAGIK